MSFALKFHSALATGALSAQFLDDILCDVYCETGDYEELAKVHPMFRRVQDIMTFDRETRLQSLEDLIALRA